MIRTILVVGVALVSVSAAHASEAPWCAMIENGTGSVYWDCQYRSFEDCYRRGNILRRQSVASAIRARTTSPRLGSTRSPGTVALARSSKIYSYSTRANPGSERRTGHSNCVSSLPDNVR